MLLTSAAALAVLANTQYVPVSPIYMVTTRGTKNGAFSRDQAAGDPRLYKLKEPTEFGPSKPPRVGNKVSDFVPLPGSVDQIGRELLGAAQVAGATRNALLILYIHGFNNDVQDAIDTAWLFRRDFTLPGVTPIVVAVTWPSDNSLWRYNQDRSDAEASAKVIGKFFAALGGERPPTSPGLRVVVVTHSMGAVVLTRAADTIVQAGVPRRPIFDEAAIVAPDLARSELDTNRFGGEVSLIVRQSTVYFSINDTVLAGSGIIRFTTGGRLGSQGALDYEDTPKNITFVNASRDVKAGRNGILGPIESHGIYWQNATFMTDFAALVLGKPAPTGYREQISERLWKLIRPSNPTESADGTVN